MDFTWTSWKTNDNLSSEEDASTSPSTTITNHALDKNSVEFLKPVYSEAHHEKKEQDTKDKHMTGIGTEKITTVSRHKDLSQHEFDASYSMPGRRASAQAADIVHGVRRRYSIPSSARLTGATDKTELGSSNKKMKGGSPLFVPTVSVNYEAGRRHSVAWPYPVVPPSRERAARELLRVAPQPTGPIEYIQRRQSEKFDWDHTAHVRPPLPLEEDNVECSLHPSVTASHVTSLRPGHPYQRRQSLAMLHNYLLSKQHLKNEHKGVLSMMQKGFVFRNWKQYYFELSGGVLSMYAESKVESVSSSQSGSNCLQKYTLTSKSRVFETDKRLGRSNTFGLTLGNHHAVPSTSSASSSLPEVICSYTPSDNQTSGRRGSISDGSNDETLFFMAQSEEEKREWMQALEGCIVALIANERIAA